MGNQLPRGILTTGDTWLAQLPAAAPASQTPSGERTSCVTVGTLLLIVDFRTHRKWLELRGFSWGWGVGKKSFCLPHGVCVGGLYGVGPRLSKNVGYLGPVASAGTSLGKA